MFEPALGVPILLHEVECKGTEERLTSCTSTRRKCSDHNTTGVICGKSSGIANTQRYAL